MTHTVVAFDCYIVDEQCPLARPSGHPTRRLTAGLPCSMWYYNIPYGGARTIRPGLVENPSTDLVARPHTDVEGRMVHMCNVLKPVPQHPLEPELDFKRGLWNRYFPGGHAMSMRSIDPGRRRGSRGEEQPPWWGLGRSPRSQR